MSDVFDPDKFLAETDPDKESSSEQSDFDPDKFLAETDPNEEKDSKTSSARAARLGVEEGVTFGADDLVAGAAGALGDFLGTDAETAQKLRDLEAQGFSGVDAPKKNTVEQLLDTYYEAKGAREAEKEKASEDRPAAYYTGLIGGGLLTGNVGSMAAKGSSKAAQLASKVLPKTSGKLIPEAAKASLVSGFTEGDAKLLEGDVLGTVADVATSGIVGTAGAGVLGGAGKLASWAGKGIGKGIKDTVTDTGFYKGYKAGEEFTKQTGLPLKKDTVLEEIENFGGEVVGKIKQEFKKLGLKKRETQELAEAVGARIDLGEDMKTALEKAVGIKALTNKSAPEKKKYINILQDISGSDSKLSKLVEKLEKQRLSKTVQDSTRKKVADTKLEKKALKDAILSGDQPIDSKVGTVSPSDFDMPASPVRMRERADSVYKEVDDEIIKSTKRNVEDVTPVAFSKPEIKLDRSGYAIGKITDKNSGKVISSLEKIDKDIIPNIEQVSIQDAKFILNELQPYANPESPAINNEEIVKQANKLYKKVKKRLDDTLDSYGGYKQFREDESRLLSALELAGIGEKNLISGLREVKDIDELRRITNFLLKQGDMADFDAKAFFDILETGREMNWKGYKKYEQMLTKARDYSDKEVDTTQVKGAFGAFSGASAKAGSIKEGTKQAISKNLSRNFDKLSKATPESIKRTANMLAKAGKSGAGYARALLRASELPQRSRNAILFNLNKQPAFRSLIKKIDPLDEYDQDE